MARAPDVLSGDLFPRVPTPAPLDSPAMDLKVRIAHAMSAAMKECPFDRFEVAARMSRILGRDVSKHMLDAYAAASRDTHIPNLAFCIAFDTATERNALLELHAALRGCSVLVGDDTVRGEIVRIEAQEEQLRKRKRALKNFLSSRGRR
jgi:hypothetical protein